MLSTHFMRLARSAVWQYGRYAFMDVRKSWHGALHDGLSDWRAARRGAAGARVES